MIKNANLAIFPNYPCIISLMYCSEICILELPAMATNSRLISLPSLCSTSKTHSYIQFFTPKNSLKYRNLSSASCGFFLTKKRTNLYPLVSALEKENGSMVVEEEGSEVEGEDARLFVANLHFNVDSETLAHLFEKAGIVEKAEVKYDRAGQSRCFGFVTMSTVEEAEKAVNMFNRYEVNGRLLDVTKAAPRGSRPPEHSQRSYEIYVGNLPYDVDNSRLEQLFSEYGKVTSAKVVCERESGRSRGFGFVFMSSDSDRNNAVENLNGQSLNGRIIRVKVAEERRI